MPILGLKSPNFSTNYCLVVTGVGSEYTLCYVSILIGFWSLLKSINSQPFDTHCCHGYS